jgi:hypothetical protein
MNHEATNCACGRPVTGRKNAATCGSRACVEANTRWHKLRWWHANRGARRNEPLVRLAGTVPELDMSTGERCDIPEVDTSDMPDTRRGGRVRM